MRLFAISLGALILVSGCNPNAQTNNPAVATDASVAERRTEAPATGESSFTETQAHERLTNQSYTNPTGLVRDRNGSWHGQATHNGQTVNVVLDYQGNVVATPLTTATTP
jgi:hypothetical protein